MMGLVSMQLWNRADGELAPRRKRATAAKELQRWLDGARQAGEVLAQAASITVVSDRESDFYELFAQRPQNVQSDRAGLPEPADRGASPRAGNGLLFSFIDGLPEQGRFVVTIPAAPGRKTRTAELAVRFAPVVLRKPLPWGRSGAARDRRRDAASTCARRRRRPTGASRSTGGC